MTRFLRVATLLVLLLPAARVAADPPQPGKPASSTVLPPEVAETLRRASEASQKKEWSRANELYAEVLARAPDSTDARFGYGATLILQGKITEGLPEIEKAIGPNPDAQALAMVAYTLRRAPENAHHSQKDMIQQYSERAFARGLADGDLDSKDPERAMRMASLALTLNREPEFRRATATLVREHPNRMQTHYFNAIRAAQDQQWVSAEDELNRAGQLGLPQEEVDRLLSQGIHEHARTRRLARYTGLAILAWVVGLAGLFLVGRTLSALTLRSLRVDDPDQAITPAQRRLRGMYRWVIAMAGFYYYISLPIVALIALLVVVALGYGVLSMPRIPVKLVLIVLAFGFAMLMMVYSIIRSCFVRIKEMEPDRTLTAEEAPELWELTRTVAARVGTRPIDEIWLTPGTDMAVFERGTRREKSRDRARRVLILGLEVIDGFRLDAFRAVLAHEYGHFLHRDTAGGDIAMRVQHAMGKFAEAIINQGNAQWWNLGWQFLRLYHFLFRRITHGASRLQEIHADRIATRVYGKDAFEYGLRHVIRRGIESNQGRALAFHRAADAGSGTRNPSHLTRLERIQRASLRRQAEVEFAKLWQTGTTEDDTHPSPVERIRLAERLRIEAAESPDGWLSDLFADPDRLRAEHQEKIDSEIKTNLTAFTSYHEQLVAQYTQYIIEHPGLGSAHFERANLLFRKGDDAKALLDYDEAIRLKAPQLALCYFNRGITRSRQGDDERAIADLQQALERDPALGPDARTEMGDIHARTGALDQAVDDYSRALALKPGDLDLLLKRADAQHERGAFSEAETDYSEILRLDPQCTEAYAGRGLARLAQGHDSEARTDLESAVRLDPNQAEAKRQLDSLLAPSPADGPTSEGSERLT